MSFDTELFDFIATTSGLTKNVSIFDGPIPLEAIADPVVGVLDFGGSENEAGLRQTLFNFLIRGSSYETTKTLAESLYGSFSGRNVVLGSSRIYRIESLSTPGWIAQDERNLHVFSMKFIFKLAK